LVIDPSSFFFEPGSLYGTNTLKLGPLEGAHTYQLAELGAGDCLKFLEESHDHFDMIFCSGILYHMENAFELIKAISRHTSRVFLCTRYHAPDILLEPARNPKAGICDGLELTFYEQAYDDPNYSKFWGGNTPRAS
jgi:hypothetical protein